MSQVTVHLNFSLAFCIFRCSNVLKYCVLFVKCRRLLEVQEAPCIVYAPVGLGLRLGLELGVLFLYRLRLGLGLWSMLTSGEWFSRNIW